MEIITTSSRGQIVIPEILRKRHNIKEGTRLVLFEQGDKLILEKEDKVSKRLIKEIDQEDVGWNILAEQSLKDVWDNEKDNKVWRKYL